MRISRSLAMVAMTLSILGVAATASPDSLAAPYSAETAETQFSWASSAQLISPQAGAPYLAVKDPTIVRVNGIPHGAG